MTTTKEKQDIMEKRIEGAKESHRPSVEILTQGLQLFLMSTNTLDSKRKKSKKIKLKSPGGIQGKPVTLDELIMIPNFPTQII